MGLEERFKEFARQQGEPVRPRQATYQRNLELLDRADTAISKVVESFCQAVGWKARRNDCCDSFRGAVGCNYILEHPDLWQAGFVAVDVEVTWGGQSDLLERVIVYQGQIVGGKEHLRVFPSRVVIAFPALTEENLAAALEQQSADVLTKIGQRGRTEWTF